MTRKRTLVRESLRDFLNPKGPKEFRKLADEIVENPGEYFKGGALPSAAEYKDGHLEVRGFTELEHARIDAEFDVTWTADVDIADSDIFVSADVTSEDKSEFEYYAAGQFKLSGGGDIVTHIGEAITFLITDIQTSKELEKKFRYS